MEQLITAADVAEIKNLLISINAHLQTLATGKPAAKPRKKEQAAPEPPEAEPKKEWSFEDVRGALAAKAAKDGGPAVRELIARFGGKKLSDIPAEKFGELMEAIDNG